MKKASLLLLALSFCMSAFAQRKPLKIGVKAGVTFPDLITSKESIAYDGGGISQSSVNTSFYFGATVDLPIGKNLEIQPGFTIVGKGTKAVFYNYLPNSASAARINLTYLEAPINLVKNIPFKSGNFFIGLGPYLGYALSGTVKYNFTSANVAVQNKQAIEFGYSKNFKRFELGANALAGYKLANGINIQAGISNSIFKISNSSDTYRNARNLVYSVGFGFSL